MGFSKIIGMCAAAAVTTAAVFLGVGCDGGETGTTTGGSSSSSSGDVGAACEPKGAVCKVVTSDCIALEDNSKAAKPGLRMAQLTITKPPVLAAGVVANIVGNGVQMNLSECNLEGGGTFSWIIEIDPATGMMKTGGAKPQANPSDGYCFVNEMLGGKQVAPISFDSGLASGSFSGKMPIDVVVPIFLDAMASTYVLMPLHQVVLDGKLSADNNCIGSYNADTLDPKNNCLAEPPDKLAFTNDGHLNGFITLEEADTVIVDTLGQSLCVLLSGDAATYGDGATPNKCKRDAMMNIVYKGAWCSTSNTAATPGMCEDAEKLEAEYAASSVKITGDCP